MERDVLDIFIVVFFDLGVSRYLYIIEIVVLRKVW